MKIACDKCLKVIDLDDKEKMLKISTEHSTFFLCKDCQKGFWQAVDNNQPPIVQRDSP